LHHVHANRAPGHAQVDPQSFGVRGDARLGCAVDRLCGRAEPGGHRSDEDHGALAPVERGEQGLGERDGGVEVDAQHVGHLVGSVLPRPSSFRDAGVVHQHIEAAELFGHLVGEGLQPIQLTQIHRPCPAVGAVGANPHEHVVEAHSPTIAPRCANPSARTAPSPDDAPVTSTRFPLGSNTANPPRF
jgi:hypothetical protein